MFDLDWKTLLRLGLIALNVAQAVTVLFITRAIGNETLKAITKNVGLILIGFGIAGGFAAVIDYYLNLEVGVFSSIRNYAFQILFLFLLIRFYLKLKADEIAQHRTGEEIILNPRYIDKSDLSKSLDAVWIALKINIRKTNEAQEIASNLIK